MLHWRGGGGTKGSEVVLTQELEFFAKLIGGGGAEGLHNLKWCEGVGVHAKFYPVLNGGVQQVLDLRFLHFVAPLPEINNRSLIEFLHS